MNNALKLARFVGIAFLPALSGMAAKPDRWYDSLEKPPMNPPNWVFAPVWTALYASMGAAQNEFSKAAIEPGKSKGESIYALQLLLNATWSLAFFRLRSPRLALVNIIMLLASISATMATFRRSSPKAAGMLLPYLLWTCFATYLNAEICRRNP